MRYLLSLAFISIVNHNAGTYHFERKELRAGVGGELVVI